MYLVDGPRELVDRLVPPGCHECLPAIAQVLRDLRGCQSRIEDAGARDPGAGEPLERGWARNEPTRLEQVVERVHHTADLCGPWADVRLEDEDRLRRARISGGARRRAEHYEHSHDYRYQYLHQLLLSIVLNFIVLHRPRSMPADCLRNRDRSGVRVYIASPLP
jgi:hypothetical protein